MIIRANPIIKLKVIVKYTKVLILIYKLFIRTTFSIMYQEYGYQSLDLYLVMDSVNAY